MLTVTPQDHTTTKIVNSENARLCQPSFVEEVAVGHESASDTVAEWLRRWTRNPLGSARVGSNPTGVVFSVSA